MKVLQTSVHIAATPEAVFAFLADPAQAPRWMALIDRLEPLDPGPVAVGSRLRVVFQAGGRRAEQTTEVIACDPPRAWALRTVEEGFDARFAYELSPDEGGTRVTFRLDIRPLTAAAWLVFPWAARGARARLRDRLDRLQRAIEAPTRSVG